jgi:hypothetical protein
MMDVPGPSEGRLFKKILGSEWNLLHPDIQERFGHNPQPDKPLYYTGHLSELSCSKFGKLLGYLTLPFLKGALLPFHDANVPVDIEVYSKPNNPSIFKQRIYHLHGRKSIQFTSYMQESSNGEVLEYVGMGLGMKLLLHVRDGDLYFTSDGYFLQIFNWRIPMPDLLTPGVVHLSHCNEDAGQFRIRIEIKHSLFGTSYIQAGVFHQISA